MKKLLAVIFCTLLNLSSPCFASNLSGSFLPDAPIRYFSAEDMEIFQTTAQKALDTGKDNQKVSWRNPHSTASGYFIPSDTTTKNGRTCRNLAIYNRTIQGNDVSAYKFCKINGEWKII